uniref:Uncharacterized protein LOC101498519 n=1 Tax=Cicer arietinum TaxID=3827 RepID=A0A3Q7XBV6_CICAR|nr:uncharacterized protein LOC101498519 [Cicer arietinum]
MDVFFVDVHHGGYFLDDTMEVYQGKVSNWKCDADRWSYFEIFDIIKQMRYPEVISIWYEAYDEEANMQSEKELFDEEYFTEELESDDLQETDKYPLFVMPKKMEDYKWVLGTLFTGKEEFKEAMTTYAIHNGRDLKFIKNDKLRVRVKCKKGCEWFAYCAKLPDEDTWQLRKLVDTHSCNREYKVKFMRSSWLGKILYSTVKENPNIKITDISNKVHQKWNAGVSKMKAFRARRVAIDMVDGSFREQYIRLYDYCHELLRSNPNSTVKLEVQATNSEVTDYVDRPLLPSFQRLYMCLNGCKESFLICRPIIGLDGCFLKGYYGGMILAAVGRDPNDQMLPIALAVVEGETRDSWTWFLKLLIDDLGRQQACKSYTFISDQQKIGNSVLGLLPAMDELLPEVEQRFCVRHLYNNFRKIHPGKKLKELMWKAAKSTYHQAWEREMKKLRKVNEETYKYLVKIPPRFWSKSRFSFNSKCDVLVNNMPETFNSVIIGPRGKPIVTMFEDIKLYLMERWARNRTTLERYTCSVLPQIKKKLAKEQELSRMWLCR